MGVYHLWLALLGLAIFLLARSIYRLYFHPLSHIPGPKLAAISHLYEIYYDIWRGGRYLFKIEQMHQQYGPIVRITPREVHIIDPEFYEEIYAPASRRREKDPAWVPIFGTPTSMVATANHEHHRFRRSVLTNFFSRRSVQSLTPMIEERTMALLKRLEEFYATQTIVHLDDAFSALSADIITYYCYGKLWCFVEDKDFRIDIRASTTEITGLSHINRTFHFINPVLRKMPGWFMRLMMPGKKGLLDLQDAILELIHSSATGKSGSGDADEKQSDDKRRAMYHNLTDPILPPEERTAQRLEDECLVVLGAGTETTARTLTIAAYYLAEDPDVLMKLRNELKQVLPTVTSTCSWTELEKLPYLAAVISESLRLATPVVGRLPRIAPDETLTYKEHTIPPGTPMSSSSLLLHHNPTIFPNPTKFDPERWIRNKGKAVTGERLDRYLTVFTKGSRACLGMNLAYAELYIALAYFVRRVDWEMYNTSLDEITLTRDFFLGLNDRGEPVVRARVTGMVQD
ncbi:cytochrome P450 [Aspergillus venezuelensis]